MAFAESILERRLLTGEFYLVAKVNKETLSTAKRLKTQAISSASSSVQPLNGSDGAAVYNRFDSEGKSKYARVLCGGEREVINTNGASAHLAVRNLHMSEANSSTEHGR